jgi:hypothetical protein
MNGAVIQTILTRDPYTAPWFRGFVTRDLSLPNKFNKPALFILNTDTSKGPGEHWCALIIFNKRRCEFFDPYGKHPATYGFEKLIDEHVTATVYNPVMVQGKMPVCGHHCLFYVLHRARGLSPHYIINKLYTPGNLKKNDATVFRFARRFGAKYAALV